MTSSSVYARGTVANLIRGLAPAVLNGILPLVLVARLTDHGFSSWSLAMSITAYIAVLQVGVYQAVTAVAAPSRRTHETSTEALPLAAAIQFLIPLMALAVALTVAVAILAPQLFPDLPHSLLPQFRLALLLQAAAGIASQFAAAGWGFAVGIGKFGPTTLAWLLGRVGGFLGAVVLAMVTRNIAVVAIGFAVPVILSLPPQLRAVGLGRRDFARAHAEQRRHYRARFGRAAKTLGVMSIGMLLVSGADGIIVGRFDFARTGVYVFVASIVTLFVGVIGSWTATYLAHAPTLGSGQPMTAIYRIGRLSMTVNFVLAAVAVVPARLLLELFFSPSQARDGYWIFVVLLIANALRQWAMPPMLSAVAGERYERLVSTGMIEGGTNFVTSVALCASIGAIGVALGTAIGALVTIPVVLLYSARASSWSALDVHLFARQALVRPGVAVGLPLTAAAAVPLWRDGGAAVLGLQIVCVLVAFVLAWAVCLDPAERDSVRSSRVWIFSRTGPAEDYRPRHGTADDADVPSGITGPAAGIGVPD